MTSTEEFAHNRLEAEQLIRQHTPEHLQEQIIALLRPIIALTISSAETSQISIGASKSGGNPDVPLDFNWPTWKGESLGFVAQINLEEVAPFDLDSLLPKSGMIWFFLALNQEDPLHGSPEEFDGWRVIFEQAPLALRQITPPEDSHWKIAFLEEPDEVFPVLPQKISFGAHWALPDELFESSTWYEFTDDEWDELRQELNELSPHRMLNCPYAPQLSPFVIAANGSQERSEVALYNEETDTSEWKLLLQLDTGTGGFFADIYDLGWLYFMIRQEDLQKADFSNVWFNAQST